MEKGGKQNEGEEKETHMYHAVTHFSVVLFVIHSSAVRSNQHKFTASQQTIMQRLRCGFNYVSR